jgi:selenoprotein W-related protein
LAAEIEQQFAIQVELIPSSGGVFEIVVNEDLIYSKKKTGKFPSEQEILDILKTD